MDNNHVNLTESFMKKTTNETTSTIFESQNNESPIKSSSTSIITSSCQHKRISYGNNGHSAAFAASRSLSHQIDFSFFSVDMETDRVTVDELLESLREIEPRLFALCQFAFQENETLREQLEKIREEYSEELDRANQLDFELKQARKQLSILLETDCNTPKKTLQDRNLSHSKLDGVQDNATIVTIDTLNKHVTNLSEENEQLKKEVHNLRSDRESQRQYGSAEAEKSREEFLLCNAELKVKSEELMRTILKLQSTMDSLKCLTVENGQLKNEIHKVEQERDSLQQKIQRLKSKKRDQVMMVATLRDRLDECQDKLTTLQSEHIRLMHQTSNLQSQMMDSPTVGSKRSRNFHSDCCGMEQNKYAFSHWSGAYTDTLDDEDLYADDEEGGGGSGGGGTSSNIIANGIGQYRNSSYSLHALDLADDIDNGCSSHINLNNSCYTPRDKVSSMQFKQKWIEHHHSLRDKERRRDLIEKDKISPVVSDKKKEEDDVQDDSSGINCKSLADEISELSSFTKQRREVVIQRPAHLQTNNNNNNTRKKFSRYNTCSTAPVDPTHQFTSSVRPHSMMGVMTDSYPPVTFVSTHSTSAFHPAPFLQYNSTRDPPNMIENASSPFSPPDCYPPNAYDQLKYASMRTDPDENTMSLLSDTTAHSNFLSPSDSLHSYGFKRKLDIMKPMDGSHTLHVWKRLATPSVTSALFDNAPQSVHTRFSLLTTSVAQNNGHNTSSSSSSSSSSSPSSPLSPRRHSSHTANTRQNSSATVSEETLLHVPLHGATTIFSPTNNALYDDSFDRRPNNMIASWTRGLMSNLMSKVWPISTAPLTHSVSSSQVALDNVGLNTSLYRKTTSPYPCDEAHQSHHDAADLPSIRQRCVEISEENQSIPSIK